MNLDTLYSLGDGWSTHLFMQIADFLPRFLMAIVIWILAWFVAKIVKKGVVLLLQKLKLNEFGEKAKVQKFLESAHFHGKLSDVIGAIIFWIIYLVGINASFEVLGLTVVSTLISDLISYIPHLFVAVLIVIVGGFIAKFVKDLTDGAVATANMDYTRLGHVVYFIVMLFVIVTALKQAQVDISFVTDNINTIVMGIMLALGLAFGLGGKDKAKEILEKYLK